MNAIEQPQWSHHLFRLRGPGRRRRQKGMPSKSLLPLLDRLPDGAKILDLGCGESGDRFIARHNGLIGYGVDLFPPSNPEHFIQADAVTLPFQSNSLDGVVCHAMIALVRPVDRWRLYDEIARVLKPEGLLSLTPQPLADGFTLSLALENTKAFAAGLHNVRRGLFSKCDGSCQSHQPIETWNALTAEVNRIDTDPVFRRTAPLLLAWFMHAGNIKKTLAFSGVDRAGLDELIRGCVKAGIVDDKERTIDAPWMDAWLRDETQEGNVCLILDVLAIRGEIKRYRNKDGQLLYRALKNKSQQTP